MLNEFLCPGTKILIVRAELGCQYIEGAVPAVLSALLPRLQNTAVEGAMREYSILCRRAN